MRWQSKRRTQSKKQNCHGLTASWGSRREVCEVRGDWVVERTVRSSLEAEALIEIDEPCWARRKAD